MTVNVHNLRTGETRVYAGTTPRDAVVAAHAQARGDWSTWNYTERYGDLVESNGRTVACGDWAARRTKS